jgi:hypothetical protein
MITAANSGFKKLGLECLMERSFCKFDFSPNVMVWGQKSPTS